MQETIQLIADCEQAFVDFDGTRFTVSLVTNDCFAFSDLQEQIEGAKPTYAIKSGHDFSGFKSLSFRIDHKALRNDLVDLALDKAMSLADWKANRETN